jgi:hypothetical protein
MAPGAVSAGWAVSGPFSWAGCGTRKTGVSRSGPLMITRAIRASMGALRWFGVPLAMISARWLATCSRVAGSGVDGASLIRVRSSSRRAASWRPVARRDQESRDQEAVNVHDPQLLDAARCEVGGQVRHGQVEHREVHRDEEGGQAEHGQPDPFPASDSGPGVAVGVTLADMRPPWVTRPVIRRSLTLATNGAHTVRHTFPKRLKIFLAAELHRRRRGR